MFSLRNRIKISYIDKNSFFLPKYNILSKNLSVGNWYFEQSKNHFLGINHNYKNFSKKDFVLKFDNHDLVININNKKYYFEGQDEEYFGKITYALEKDGLSYIRLDKSFQQVYIIQDNDIIIS